MLSLSFQTVSQSEYHRAPGLPTGFGAVVARTGISFVIQARVNGTQRQQTIGKAGHLRDDGQTWNVQRARFKAKELLGDAAAGVDNAGGPMLGDALDTIAVRAALHDGTKQLAALASAPPTMRYLPSARVHLLGQGLESI